MKRRLRFFVCFALLLCCAPLHAQWSGSIDFAGGLGGMEGSVVNDYAPMYHGLLDGALRLNYQTKNFKWNTVINGRWDFTWTPSLERKVSLWIMYQFTDDQAYNHTLNFDGDIEELNKFSYYYEFPVMNRHKTGVGLKTYRSFNAGRNILQSSIVLKTDYSDIVNTWAVFKAGEGVDGGTIVDIDSIQGHVWEYRITPKSTDINLDGDIYLENTIIDGDVQLKLTPGARLSTRTAAPP